MSQTTAERLILFADVSGSTQLYERLGDERAKQSVSFCLDRLTEITDRHGGRVLKTIGDAVMAVFDACDPGLVTACAMQQYFDENATTGPVQIAIRVGLHFGEVLQTRDDVFGDTVNIAARVVALARARQILTTEATIAGLSRPLIDRTRALVGEAVTDRRDGLQLFEVIWESPDEVTRLAPAALLNPQAENEELRLRYRDRDLRLTRDGTCTLGRDEGCDLVCNGRLTSRTHARIEYRYGKFVLIDESTNGTFVLTQDGKEIYLRREELPLWGLGTISLGEALGIEPQEAVSFLCQ